MTIITEIDDLPAVMHQLDVDVHRVGSGCDRVVDDVGCCGLDVVTRVTKPDDEARGIRIVDKVVHLPALSLRTRAGLSIQT